MVGVLLAAIPFFVVSIVIEAIVLVRHGHGHDHDGPEGDRRATAAVAAASDATPAATIAPLGYERRDTRTSITMGAGHLVIRGAWKIVLVAIFAAAYTVTPLRVPMDAWWGWVLLFVADDLAFYAFHRAHHRVRLFWAMHVVHHSSQRFNLSTALRQDWTPFTAGLFWLWMPFVGFPPWAIFLAQSWSLLYQFGLHTETIGRLPRPVEWIFNTPSHHRVHHGSQPQYLDRNYGGILIVWDRLFGTFAPERERVRYGLTRNIDTFNPVRVAFHEYVAIWRDVRAARTWRDRLGYAFRGPGWTPAAARSDPPVGAQQADRVDGRDPAPLQRAGG